MPSANILVATDGKLVHIRVIGQATFACSQGLRDFGLHMLDQGVAHIFLDLSECLTMDSTFMGVMSMVGLRGREKKVGVTIVNASDANQRLLASLGVKRLFAFNQTGGADVTWTTLKDAVPPAVAAAVRPLDREKTILEAHETLMALDAENVPKFKDVVDFLRDDIQKLQN